MNSEEKKFRVNERPQSALPPPIGGEPLGGFEEEVFPPLGEGGTSGWTPSPVILSLPVQLSEDELPKKGKSLGGRGANRKSEGGDES